MKTRIPRENLLVQIETEFVEETIIGPAYTAIVSHRCGTVCYQTRYYLTKKDAIGDARAFCNLNKLEICFVN